MKSLARVIQAVCLLLLSVLSIADEIPVYDGVFLRNLEDTSSALASTVEAFKRRGWKLNDLSEKQAIGVINRKGKFVKLTITIDKPGKKLRYVCECYTKSAPKYQKEIYRPVRWIKNLRSDARAFMELGVRADDLPSKSSIRSRLEELRELLDVGLITQDEYSFKKEQILSEL